MSYDGYKTELNECKLLSYDQVSFWYLNNMNSEEVIVEIMKVNANNNNLLYENFFEITDCSNYCKNYPDSLCWLHRL